MPKIAIKNPCKEWENRIVIIPITEFKIAHTRIYKFREEFKAIPKHNTTKIPMAAEAKSGLPKVEITGL